ncbi:hypothetical protein HDV05_002914 [Chytridiales sp. JEL 0842]|nr:hypothetical protein HDV05_002914 [Chytridiales sp. JEL 0842]
MLAGYATDADTHDAPKEEVSCVAPNMTLQIEHELQRHKEVANDEQEQSTIVEYFGRPPADQDDDDESDQDEDLSILSLLPDSTADIHHHIFHSSTTLAGATASTLLPLPLSSTTNIVPNVDTIAISEAVESISTTSDSHSTTAGGLVTALHPFDFSFHVTDDNTDDTQQRWIEEGVLVVKVNESTFDNENIVKEEEDEEAVVLPYSPGLHSIDDDGEKDDGASTASMEAASKDCERVLR